MPISSYRDLRVWQAAMQILRHISIAMGSLAELETQLELSVRLKFVERKVLNPIFDLVDGVGKMLRGLQKTLKAKRAPSP